MQLPQRQVSVQAIPHLSVLIGRALVTPRLQPVLEASSAAAAVQLLPQHPLDSVDLGAMPILVEASLGRPTSPPLGHKTILAAAYLELDLAPIHSGNLRTKRQVDSATLWGLHSAPIPLNVKVQAVRRFSQPPRKMEQLQAR